jgi:alpha-tubulin suppressor-like RCC1 family protein
MDASGLTIGVSAIVAGAVHTCALTGSSGVQCWGYNFYGQLGDGTTTDRYTAVDVSGLTSDVRAIGSISMSEHTCALTINNGAKCWGRNVFGQLGDGTTNSTPNPVDVSGLTSDVRAIATGSNHTCALTMSDGVKCWGSNSNGQLGDSTIATGKTHVDTPLDVSGLTSGMSAIATGGSYTCALTSGGGVKCWGRNNVGQLGDGTTIDRHTPVDVSVLTGTALSTPTSTNTATLTSTPTFTSTPTSTATDTATSTTTPNLVDYCNLQYPPSFVIESGQSSPLIYGRIYEAGVTDLAGANLIVKAQVGYGPLGSDPTGNVNWTWFPTTFNRQYGNDDEYQGSFPVPTVGTTTQFAYTYRFTLNATYTYCDSDGAGTNPGLSFNPGLLGFMTVNPVATATYTSTPTETYTPTSTQTFTSTPTDTSTATPTFTATSIPMSQVSAIAGGYGHSCALLTNGQIQCWGSNGNGQLGDGTTITQLNPVEVSGFGSGLGAITAGESHTCALRSAGDVKCWGFNGNGQLGDGTTSTRLKAVDVSGLTSGISAISAGDLHTCALATSGGVKCWGFNAFGQLGDGTTNQRNTPTGVNGLASGVSAIAAGWYHTCALMSGGVKCWGQNAYGELGDGTTNQRNSPVGVSGLTSGVSAIAAGYAHTCALMTSGGVKCWGANDNGQLGDGTLTDRYTPVDVSGLTSGVRVIAAGYYHTCALMTSGGVKCWGANFYGELGDGTTQPNMPVNVSGLANGVSAIAAGWYHNCALTTSRGVKCWGRNIEGQLGDGTTTQRNTPVDVTGLTGTFTATPTATFTSTPINTPTSTPTYTPTLMDTDTPTPIPTFTPIPTDTATPTYSPTATDTETPTSTPTYTSTPTVTPSPTNTATFTPTFTPTPTPTFTSTPTSTATPTATPTYSPTNTPTATPTASGNTPIGNNIQAQPIDSTGGTTPVTLTFAQVTQGGTTSLTTSSSGPPPPTGFKLGNPPTYYELSTTALFVGSITLCIDYTGISVSNESNLKLSHYENGAWVDRTISLDTTNNIICASITSLSPFAIFEPNYNFSGFLSPVDNPNTVNTGKAGKTYPIKWQLTGANNVYVSTLSAVASITYRPTSCSVFTGDPTDALETSVTGGTSLRYDSTANQYIYNWATPGAGCYTLFLKLDSGQVFYAYFNLK